jgi:hypothetical protein
VRVALATSEAVIVGLLVVEFVLVSIAGVRGSKSVFSGRLVRVELELVGALVGSLAGSLAGEFV